MIAHNPAHLTAQLASLFPAGVVAAELLGNAPTELLTQAELRSIAHCAEKRIADFTAGRACAHRALQELGIRGFSLLSGADRNPIWPPGITGSITHSEGYRAAVVARQGLVRALGIDCEAIAAVDEELWSRICVPEELEAIGRLPAEQRQRRAALHFAAKEAFYKCQYPLTKQWVGFEDMVIEPTVWPAAAGGLRLRAQKPLELPAQAVEALLARFEFRERWVIAGISATVGNL